MQTLRDIPLKVDPSFFLLLAVVGLPELISGGPSAAASLVVFLLTVFGLVVLHEYGHCWAAIRCGLRVDSITLWALGGLARISGYGSSPKEELFISAAGPAVNAILAGVSFAALAAGVGGDVLARFAVINLALCIFNLVPAYPLDGGRMLKAILSFWIPERTALRVSARIGQALAVLTFFWALSQGLVMLALVAVFVFLSCKSAIR